MVPDLNAVHPHGIHNHHAFPRWYGSTPTLQNHTGEGIFPVHGIPVLCEWLDVPHANNSFDHGPKASINQLLWTTPYEANAVGPQDNSGSMTYTREGVLKVPYLHNLLCYRGMYLGLTTCGTTTVTCTHGKAFLAIGGEVL